MGPQKSGDMTTIQGRDYMGPQRNGNITTKQMGNPMGPEISSNVTAKLNRNCAYFIGYTVSQQR